MELTISNLWSSGLVLCGLQMERASNIPKLCATIFNHHTHAGLHIFDTMSRYILFTGAPGSKWSGVMANIYQSPDIDQSDNRPDRQYESGAVQHFGSYFDPGMEFDNDVSNWDQPFNGTGRRIIRSHTFAHQLHQLSTLGHPIVMVYRNDYECFDWWCNAGGFAITYPNYINYYGDLDNMWQQIKAQNYDIMEFIKNHTTHTAANNIELCHALAIAVPPNCKVQDYSTQDTRVYIHNV